MIKWLLRQGLKAFEKHYDYDASYAHFILDTSVRAAWKFARVMGLANYRQDVPAEASVAAGLVTTMAEDCGPCTQLGVTMAERQGVAPSIIRAILDGDERAMTPDAALAYRFAQATLRHDPAADALREQIVARWGRRALVSLAFTITAGRMFPTLKYALGFGKSCSIIKVGSTQTTVTHKAA